MDRAKIEEYEVPVLCPKCNNANYRTLKSLLKDEKLSCDKCKFEWDNDRKNAKTKL